MSKLGALQTLLEAAKPLAVNARSMVGDIAQSLKGGLATGEQWYNQLKNMPGVKPEKLQEAFGHMQDGKLQMTKDAFLSTVVKPKLYTQPGYAINTMSNDMRESLAAERTYDAWYQSTDLRRGALKRILDTHLADNADGMTQARRMQLLEHINNGEGISAPRTAMLTASQSGAEREALLNAWNYTTDTYEDSPEFQRLLANEMSIEAPRAKEFLQYQGYQKQPYKDLGNNQYFETVLRQGPQEGRNLTNLTDDSYHFNNPGQIAHARGVIQSGVDKGPSMLLDEIQSDPYQALTEQGLSKAPGYSAIKNPHGDMAKALLLQAAKGGAARMVIPDANNIAQLRGGRGILPAMQNIYDDQLYKQFYKPLDAMGIPMKENNAGYRSIELPPDVADGLNKYGLPFKDGGAVSKSAQFVASLVKNQPKEITNAYKESRNDPGILSGIGVLTSPFEVSGNAAGDAAFEKTGSPAFSTAAYMLGSGAVGPGLVKSGAKTLGTTALKMMHEGMTFGKGPLAALQHLQPNIIPPSRIEQVFKDFEQSKIRNSGGDLMPVYHGGAGIEAGLPNKGNGIYSEGTYFSGFPGRVKPYAENAKQGATYPMYANLQNPISADDFRSRFGYANSNTGKGIRDQLVSEGYDGVTSMLNDKLWEGVAFHPEHQLKSAISAITPDIQDEYLKSATQNFNKYAQGGEVTTPSKLKEFYDAWRKSVTSAAQDYTMPFESSTYNNQDVPQSPRMGPDGSTIYSKSRYAQGGEVTPMVPPRIEKLGPHLNNLYSLWADNNHAPKSNDYDMQGYFMDRMLGKAEDTGINSSDLALHYPDTYKLPNHHSFSNESKYSIGKDDPHWVENPPPYQDGTYKLQGTNIIETPLKFAQGGEVKPYQPSKMNNTFMAGGLNIINPKNKNKGPLNIQYNANNLLAKSRAQ